MGLNSYTAQLVSLPNVAKMSKRSGTMDVLNTSTTHTSNHKAKSAKQAICKILWTLPNCG